jgi:hypothetical protein
MTRSNVLVCIISLENFIKGLKVRHKRVFFTKLWTTPLGHGKGDGVFGKLFEKLSGHQNS